MAFLLVVTILVIFTGCEQSATEENIPTLGKIVISLDNLKSANAKTLLPDSLTAPSSYAISLQAYSPVYNEQTQETTYIKSGDPSSPVFSSNDTNGVVTLTLSNVATGYYTVMISGYNEASMRTMTGTSSTYFHVTADGTNNVAVTMKALNSDENNEGLTGSLSVDFDWSAVSTSNDIMISSLKKGALTFELFMRTMGTSEAYTSVSKQTVPTATQTTFTFKADGIPVTSGDIAYFKIYDAEGTVITPNFLLLTVQIYAGQTSVGDANEPDTYTITANNLTDPKNVYDVSWDYAAGAADSSVVISWKNQMSRAGVNLFASVNLTYSASGVSETTINIPTSSDATTGSYTITGMTPGNEYTIKMQAVLTNGQKAANQTITFAKPLMAKVVVSGIIIDSTALKSQSVYGDTFTLSAAVKPDSATFKDYTWSISNAETFRISGDTFTSYAPGKTTITATSSDDETFFATTASVSVILKAPENITATKGTDSISVVWASVPFAESYELYRKAGDADFLLLSTTATTSYDDNALIAGVAYTYKVKAIAPSLVDGEFTPTSAFSTATETLTPVIPTVTITVPTTITDNFTITLSHPEQMVLIPSSTDESKKALTVSLTSAISGITEYAWYINEETTPLESGTFEGGAGSITITEATKGIYESADGGLNNLILSVYDGTAWYSSTTTFSVIDVLDESVSWSVPSDLKRLATTNGTVQITANVMPANATLKSLTYTSSDETVATVNATGLVTIKKYGNATITVSPAYGTPSTIDFDFYQPTVTSSLTLLGAVNGVMRTHFTAANTQFGGDWWPGEKSSTYSAVSGLVIASPQDAAQSAGTATYTNFSTDTALGTIIMNTTTALSLYAKDGGNWAQSGYLGTDPLQYIGYNNTGDLAVTLPYNQGTATIHYNGINVIDRGGTYTVTFSESVLGTDAYNPISGGSITDDSTVTRILN